MKKIIWIIVIIILLVLGYFYFKGSDSKIENQNTNIENQTIVENTENSQETGEVKIITMAELQSHNSKEDCWTDIGGKVYDLTKFVSQHPGGEDSIAKICGKDGTEVFNAQHGGGQMQQDVLTQLYIGDLATN